MNCITAKIITHSISSQGKDIITYELEYPRFIHAEFMTHRLFSRNAASSRAIPIEKMMDQVTYRAAMPISWGLNKPGMQAGGVHESTPTCVWAWTEAAQSAVDSAKVLQKLGLHKQIVNRILEPFQVMKTVMTSTEMDNFFYLRSHSHAQPEIHYLSDLMYDAWQNSTPRLLQPGQWHLPYISPTAEALLTLKDAQKVSASCCAQVSYRLLDDSLDKAVKIYDALVTNKPVHASPFEHLATPIDYTSVEFDDPKSYLLGDGITHVDSKDQYWSGNFQGWVQYRQLLSGHDCTRYSPEAPE